MRDDILNMTTSKPRKKSSFNNTFLKISLLKAKMATVATNKVRILYKEYNRNAGGKGAPVIAITISSTFSALKRNNIMRMRAP